MSGVALRDGELEDVFRERRGRHHDGAAHRGHDGGEHGGEIDAARNGREHLGNEQRNDHVGILHLAGRKHHVAHHAGGGQRPGENGGKHHAHDHGHAGGAYVAHGENGHALLRHGNAHEHGDGENDEQIGPAHFSAARDVEQIGINGAERGVELGEQIRRNAAEGRLRRSREDGDGAEHHDDALNEVRPHRGEIAAHDAVHAHDDRADEQP